MANRAKKKPASVVRKAAGKRAAATNPKVGKVATGSDVREAPSAAGPRLLAGGNPQIAKGTGDAPVQAYIAAMSGGGPGWKREVGRRVDAIIVRTVPGVRKAVKWNSPLYGTQDPAGGWFLALHCFTHYVKVAFFRGSSLRPIPPGASKQKDVRYLDIREGWGSPADEAQLADWVMQAIQLPGEHM